MARIGVRPPAEEEESEKPRALPKLGIRNKKGAESDGVTGSALEQNRATQFGYGNKSTQTTGNKNYEAPGSAGGMT